MIIKLDESISAEIEAFGQKISQSTQVKPKSQTLIVRVLLEWALKRVNDTTVQELAPQMLTLSQQRKTLINEIRSLKGQLDEKQVKAMMKTLGQLKSKPPESENKTSDNVA